MYSNTPQEIETKEERKRKNPDFCFRNKPLNNTNSDKTNKQKIPKHPKSWTLYNNNVQTDEVENVVLN